MTDTTVTGKAARDELYEIIRREAPFEQKANEALELGKRYLGVDNGHLTRIDQETQHWETIASTDSSDGRFPPGLELELGTTYCRRTLEANSQITLYDAPNQGWEDDPAFETHGLHCYHGTPLILNDEPYGTVCFVAEEPREQFNDGETMFAELIARLLERELEREQHEAQLTRQSNLATVLNRVLRHNLRNDMSVIRGMTQLMAEERAADDSYGQTALKNIDKLLALTQKARELDRIVAADREPEPTDITRLVESIVKKVRQKHPRASVSTKYDDEITAAVQPSFERALEELLENAAKHSGEAPTVTVSVEHVPNAVEIRIVDDGLGLADHEAEVLRTGSETPLTHGSGLGLWLAYWIITSHDGSISATSTEDGTTMTISIPRKTDPAVQQQLSKLTRARDQYQAAFEAANDAMVILNDDARIIDANPEASSIYGMDQQALLGQPLQQFLPDDFDFEIAWREFRNSERVRDTVTIVGADGVERQVEYSATTEIVPGQHLVVSRDITERKRQEYVQKQSETLFQNAQDALFLVDVGDEFTVQRVNPAYETATGFSNEVIQGKTPRDILGDEQGRAVERRYRECVELGDTLDYEEEFIIDGEVTIWETRITPVTIDDEVGKLVGATRNITERKQRERRYDAVFNNTYQFMGLLDPEGHVLEANKPALAFAGLDQNDVVGEQLWETPWFQGSEQSTERAYKMTKRASEGEFVRTKLMVQGQNEEVLIDFSIRPVIDETGAVTYLVPEGRCIDELESQERVDQSVLGPW